MNVLLIEKKTTKLSIAKMHIIVRQLKHLLFIFLIIFSPQLFANSVVGKSLFCKDSKNQYRGIHFLDEKFVISYRFYDQSMVDRKVEYELSGTDIIRFDPKNISSSYRFLYRKDLRLSGGSQCTIIESKEKLISQLKKNLVQILQNNKL